MIFNQNKNLINKLKILKSIKANSSFKSSLKINLQNEIGSVTNPNVGRLYKQQNQSTVLQKIINIYQFNYKTMIPLILILTLLGGGAGATYASQNALPGDTLYPIKIASEKVETALAFSDSRDAKLHLDFATRRLSEINKLAEKGKASTTAVDNAVTRYNQELANVQDILNKTEKENSVQIATNLDNKLTENKGILRALSKQIDNKDSLKELSDAWEKSIEHGDTANLILLKDILSGPSQDGEKDKKVEPEVMNKIQSAERKISETENYITKKGSEGIDISGANLKITEAKNKLQEAKDLLAQKKYEESFMAAKDSYKIVKDAKDLVEQKDVEKNGQNAGQKEDYKNTFVDPSVPNIGNESDDNKDEIKKEDGENNSDDNKIENKKEGEDDNKNNEVEIDD